MAVTMMQTAAGVTVRIVQERTAARKTISRHRASDQRVNLGFCGMGRRYRIISLNNEIGRILNKNEE
jgi:hypothetical protein